MLTLVLATSVLAFDPPVLPEESSPPGSVEGPAEAPAEAPAETLPVESESFVISPAPVAAEAELPLLVAPTLIELELPREPARVEVQTLAIPRPPWSGSGRLVGGPIMLIAGTGLLAAATFEFAGARNANGLLFSQIPAGISMLVAGGVMLGTGLRDQNRLAEWETASKHEAPPNGNGLIVAGVATTTLGIMTGVATAIAADMDLDAPLSIPAGWATTGLAAASGTTMLIAGIVRRARYGHWLHRNFSTPLVVPVRAGATIGVAGQF